jgi:PAS domain S-box-containing protein
LPAFVPEAMGSDWGAMDQGGRSVVDELVELFDLSHDAFCIAGFDGYLKRANPAFARSLGYTLGELLARPFMANVYPDDVESVERVLEALAAGKDIVGFECREVCADGSVRWFEWSTSSRPEAGIVFGVARDVTDRRIANAELSALRRVATLVAEEAEPRDLFALVAEEVARVVKVPFSLVARYELDGTATECASFPMGTSLFPVGKRWSLDGTNVLALVRTTSGAARLDDLAHLNGELAEAARRGGIRSTVGVPIIVAGRLWGAMAVCTTEPSPLPDDTEARLANFTGLLATAIGNAESRGALGLLADEQAALRRVATLVGRGASPAEVFDAVADELARYLDVVNAGLLRFEADGTGYVLAVRYEPGTTTMPVTGEHIPLGGDDVGALVLRTGRAARVDNHDTASGPEAARIRAAGIGSIVGVPVIVDGRLWGAAIVGSTSPEPMPSDTETRLADFADLVATAIGNAATRVELQASRDELSVLAEQQAALRRVATLVARGVGPSEVYSAVAAELARVLAVQNAAIWRYDTDGAATLLAAGDEPGAKKMPVGDRFTLEGDNVAARVLHTGRPARMDSLDEAAGSAAARIRELGIRSGVGAPIIVDGHLWGAAIVGTLRTEPLPRDTETRVCDFADLVATAIANAQAHDELTASRARIVAAADEARRRIERDLHDGAQQRLVALGLQVRLAEASVPTDLQALGAQLGEIVSGLTGVTADLQEISRGIHPSILSKGGFVPALKTLARRSAVPVTLELAIDRRMPESVEVGVYYVVSEALTNTAKHARASHVTVRGQANDDVLSLSIGDDGIGGADVSRGSGLIGLRDRVEALGGRMRIVSPAGSGTSLDVTIPLDSA